MAAIAFFVLYVRRQSTELTCSVPAGLAEATRVLADLKAGAVFVLPYMYADYVCYRSGKSVVWGGHCGDLGRFEWITPVLRRPLPEMFDDLRVRYLLLDDHYARPEDLDLCGRVQTLCHHEGFEVFEYQGSAATGPGR